MAQSLSRVGWLTVAGLGVSQTLAAGQPGLRPPAEFRMRPITGFAELSCDFRNPETALENVAQGREIELVITIKSDPTGVKYRLTDAVQTRPEPVSVTDRTQHGIRMVGRPRVLNDDASPTSTSFRHVSEHLLMLQVDPGAPPRSHDIQLTFSAEGRRDEMREISFFLAPRDSEKEKYVNASATEASPRITAGADTSLSLTIANSFPTYRLTLRQIEISSDPHGLIDNVSQPRSETIASGGSRRIEVTVHGRHSLLRQLWPVETKPKLKVILKYDDGYRSEIERMPPIPIEFTLEANPGITFSFAALSVVVGSLIGAWLRMTFTTAAPSERGVSTLKRVIASLLLSAIVVLFIVFTKIELLATAAAFRIELHKPIATGLISVLVGLYNPVRLIETIRDKFGLGAPKPVSQS
jgi:hypothetical protein